MAGVGHFHDPESRSHYVACYDEAIRLCPNPRESCDIETTFGWVRSYRHGPDDGPPIVLLSGRAATSAMWAPNLPAFAAKNPIYALDTLGEPGCSVQAVPIRTGADHAAWLDEVLTTLGLHHGHLVGSSAGGWLAFNQAIHAPHRLASITLLDPAHVLARFSPKFVLGALSTKPGMPHQLTDRFLSWVSGGPQMDSSIARLLIAGMRCYREDGERLHVRAAPLAGIRGATMSANFEGDRP